MTLFNHEMKQNNKTFWIWASCIGFMVVLCMAMFPEMQSQMGNINDMFSNMGSFTTAFGMDKINFGTAMGFYGIECGTMLSLGGAFYAALIGINALSKEESGHTSEFLLTHPVSRRQIVTEKLMAIVAQILCLNIVCVVLAIASFLVIGESIEWKEFLLFHLAQMILHIETAAICFGISAFIRRGGLGVGLGLASLLYFLNIFANISEKAAVAKYITPFQYADAANILTEAALDIKLILIGLCITLLSIAVAFGKYCKKDIAN